MIKKTRKMEEKRTVYQKSRFFSLEASKEELNLRNTLMSGQAFRWREEPSGSDEWHSTMFGRVLFLSQSLKQGNQEIPCVHFSFLISQEEAQLQEEVAKELKEKLSDYFQLQKKFSDLFSGWKNKDKNFLNVEQKFSGLRLMRQDCHETFFGFICSQNNNIKRISSMIHSLCEKYGSKVEHEGNTFHFFPNLEQLSKCTEDELRELSFGYRAPYIVNAVSHLLKNGSDWLVGLRKESKVKVREELVKVKGVGKKVADCIALFSLDKTDLVPVDTHMFAIAQTYMPELKGKSLTANLYKEIETHFADLWGEEAGWAHTLLFANRIAAFKEKKAREFKRKKSAPKKSSKKAKKHKEESEEIEADYEEDESYEPN